MSVQPSIRVAVGLLVTVIALAIVAAFLTLELRDVLSTGAILAALLLALLGVYRQRLSRMESRERELEALVALRTRELREATLRDTLTGLRTRRFLREVVQPEAAIFAERKQFLTEHVGPRPAHPVDLFMGVFAIDIDRFQEINDQFGLGAGDRVLRQFAELLGRAIRKDDIAVRWGGEEFLIVLRHTTFEHVSEFAVALRRRIEDHSFNVSEDPDDVIRRTCSIGYAPFPFHRDEPERFSFDQVVMLADLGLAHAKGTGRNHSVGVLPTATPPSAGDVAPMVASLVYGEGNGLLEIRTEETFADDPALVTSF